MNTESTVQESASVTLESIRKPAEHSSSEPLLTQPITKQFMLLALPIIISLMINGLYSFIDAIFITRGVGIEAMAAVSAVFPIHMLIISISGLLGTGMASIISRKLGSGDREGASQVFSNSMLFAITVGLICSVVMFFSRHSLFDLLALPSNLLGNANSYLLPILSITAFSFASGTLSECFRASGKAKDMMKVMLFGSLANILFDALFIFGFKWGVAGAAWATVVAMMLSLTLAIRLQLSGSDRVKLQWRYLRYNWQTHKQVLALGLPTFLSHGGFAFTLALTIYAITLYSGSDASMMISAHGLLMRSFMLLFLPLLGMVIALQTLSGFNYGAGKIARVKQSLITAIAFGTIWTSIVTLILVYKPQWLLTLFTDDIQLIAVASDISSIAFLGFVCAASSMMCSGVFQAMGKALPAMLLDSTRTYILLLPVLLNLPKWLGVEGIWLSFPIADYSGALLAVTFTTWYFHKRVN
ncbi:MATE family efflux transporter [Aliivibrio kagoshimensis]|uniref:MATE family efflux transporter n=1 Tax=Aliivibrio kagoshimensis TaxID=2910230 RepID=UPI003D1307C6